jgi:hypothetical protein
LGVEKMKLKWLFFTVLSAFLVLAMDSGSQAVDTRPIDAVLKKGVLDNEDLQIIDDFVAEAVQELVQTGDLTDIAQNRTVILSRQSDQSQYAQQFSESAYKHISSGLREASRLTPEDRRVVVTANLLILIDGLEDLRLADLAISKLADKSTVVQYLAAKCITSPGIIKKLSSGGESNLRLTRSIAMELNKLVESDSPEIIALMARFAAGVQIKEAEDLLLKIANVRIKRYAEWKVKFEPLDDIILKSLCSKIYSPATARSAETSASQNNTAIARSFSQLYSYVIQRYVKGGELLSDTQKGQLASVIIETEDKCISKLLGKTQTGMKRAIEADDTAALLREHDMLLGDERAAGQLPLKLGFKYSGAGGRQTAPDLLPMPPGPTP